MCGQTLCLIRRKFHRVLRAKHGPCPFQSNLMRVKENLFRYLIYGAFGGQFDNNKAAGGLWVSGKKSFEGKKPGGQC